MAPDTLALVCDWLAHLISPDQVFEIRGIGQRTFAGFFDYRHLKEAAIYALGLANQKDPLGGWAVHGVYWTLNPLDPSILARRSNRLAVVERGFQLAGDSDVIRRRWLLIDCDPVRTAGVSSSHDELVASFDLICDVREHLRSYISLDPIFCESGNGFHLLYGIDMPNDDASTKTVKDILRYLASKFDNSRAKIDTSVFNASRICKFYGTFSRKGDSTEARPHRRAGIPTFIHAQDGHETQTQRSGSSC